MKLYDILKKNNCPPKVFYNYLEKLGAPFTYGALLMWLYSKKKKIYPHYEHAWILCFGINKMFNENIEITDILCPPDREKYLEQKYTVGA